MEALFVTHGLVGYDALHTREVPVRSSVGVGVREWSVTDGEHGSNAQGRGFEPHHDTFGLAERLAPPRDPAARGRSP